MMDTLLDPVALAAVFGSGRHDAALLHLVNTLGELEEPVRSISPMPFPAPAPTTRIPPPVLSLRGEVDNPREPHMILVCHYPELLPDMQHQLMWLASRALVNAVETLHLSFRHPVTVLALCGVTAFPGEHLLHHFGLTEETTGKRAPRELFPLDIVCLDFSKLRVAEPPRNDVERWAHLLFRGGSADPQALRDEPFASLLRDLR